MRIKFDCGPTRWSGPRGWFKPTGTLLCVGDDYAENPADKQWQSRVTWGARLFVGLNVGVKKRWTAKQVVAWVKKHWQGGASFIAQQGLWPSQSGKLVPESAVQVILLNVPRNRLRTDPRGSPATIQPLPPREFVDEAIDLASLAARDFRQESVVVEVQRNGIVKETYGIAWKN